MLLIWDKTVICIEKHEDDISKICIETGDKEPRNFSFNLSDNGIGELEFYILKKDDIDLNEIITNDTFEPSDEIIELDKEFYLFNPEYKLLLSLNDYDQYNNSFIATNYADLNDPDELTNSDNTYSKLVPKFCTLNINMVNRYQEFNDYIEFKKVCYRTEPYKINDFSKAKYSDKPCEENQININDSSDFYMCLDKKFVSDVEYDKMVQLQPSDNYGLNPFPVPN